MPWWEGTFEVIQVIHLSNANQNWGLVRHCFEFRWPNDNHIMPPKMTIGEILWKDRSPLMEQVISPKICAFRKPLFLNNYINIPSSELGLWTLWSLLKNPMSTNEHQLMSTNEHQFRHLSELSLYTFWNMYKNTGLGDSSYQKAIIHSPSIQVCDVIFTTCTTWSAPSWAAISKKL